MSNMITTTEAFRVLINTRGIYHKLGKSEVSVRQLRKNFNDNPTSVSITMMEDLLTKAGFKVVQEKLWAKEE